MAKTVKFEDVQQIIKEKAAQLLSGVSVVDVYEGADVPKNCSVFTLRIFYQAQDRTLLSSDAAVLHDSVREALAGKDGIDLR
ncbi:MAG: hypothetical protein ABIH71_03310 [Candidatus Omnitrophota bacterium]